MTSMRGHPGSGCSHLAPVHYRFTAVGSRVAAVGLCVLAVGFAVLESLFLVPTHVTRVLTKLFLGLCRRCLVASFHVLAQVDTILLHLGHVAAHRLLILPCVSLILTRILTRIGWSRLSECN